MGRFSMVVLQQLPLVANVFIVLTIINAVTVNAAARESKLLTHTKDKWTESRHNPLHCSHSVRKERVITS
jgi:hypothetical protein